MFWKKKQRNPPIVNGATLQPPRRRRYINPDAAEYPAPVLSIVQHPSKNPGETQPLNASTYSYAVGVASYYYNIDTKTQWFNPYNPPYRRIPVAPQLRVAIQPQAPAAPAITANGGQYPLATIIRRS